MCPKALSPKPTASPTGQSVFAQQSYPNRELLVVDDGSDCAADLAEGAHNVRYLRLRSRTSIGAKRNLACQQAQGEIIAQWDDDDWYSHERLAAQAAPILRKPAAGFTRAPLVCPAELP